MGRKSTEKWLDALGYLAAPEALHRSAKRTGRAHPYAREIKAMLDPAGDIGAAAVFDVDQVPSVCFIDAGKRAPDADWLAAIRQKIWNQGLVSLLLVLNDEHLLAYPVRGDSDQRPTLQLADATVCGPFSVRDIQSSDVQKRHPEWFALECSVDRELLNNLKRSVLELMGMDIGQAAAQFLLGQCLFVSYLEHREIISSVYRNRRKVQTLRELIASADSEGLVKLFGKLKKDFNGDFLAPGSPKQADWRTLPAAAYDLLYRFLSRVNIETGQGSLWNYDFRYIPVELISGIYETFLGDDQEKLGAYYTPRHLAHLAVDQAFLFTPDPSAEVVFDGACGSGILLTTAFRKMIASREQRLKREMSFGERCSLLEEGIRGGDISEAACRVTAFSLYLSLLEDLKPSDILLLQEDENVKLPELINRTILSRGSSGDFFSRRQRFTSDRRCTIFLSNPPWKEPEGDKKNLPYEVWAKENGWFLPHRQIAAAFAHKALDAISEGGRFCLILPVKLFTARTSQRFLQQWLSRCHVERIINFSDIRRLLFAEAIHPCVIVTGTASNRSIIPYNETLEYWVPKADVSLAFSRLTIHNEDRRELLTQDIRADNQTLRTYLWGGELDAALVGRLSLEGTISDLTRGKGARWQIVKGFNRSRRTSAPLPIEPLSKMRFLDARRIPRDTPVLDAQLLEPFPREITSVVSYGSKNGAAFEGPRVLFPDGAKPDFEVNAVFARKKFCFKHSVTAIRGPKADEDLLRFLTLYLRSDLVKYLLLHTAYSLAAERPRITLKEVEGLPFILPDWHQDQNRARQIIREAADITREWEAADVFAHYEMEATFRARAQRLIFDYFDISEREAVLISDTCDVLIPSVQPGSYQSIRTPQAASPTADDLGEYVLWLDRELNRWKDALGGSGSFKVAAVANKLGSVGAMGVVRISLSSQDSEARVKTGDKAVTDLIAKLAADDLLPLNVRGNLYLAADFLVQAGRHIYLIKPLVKRLWLGSKALHDARRIVDSVHDTSCHE